MNPAGVPGGRRQGSERGPGGGGRRTRSRSKGGRSRTGGRGSAGRAGGSSGCGPVARLPARLGRVAGDRTGVRARGLPGAFGVGRVPGPRRRAGASRAGGAPPPPPVVPPGVAACVEGASGCGPVARLPARLGRVAGDRTGVRARGPARGVRGRAGPGPAQARRGEPGRWGPPPPPPGGPAGRGCVRRGGLRGKAGRLVRPVPPPPAPGCAGSRPSSSGPVPPGAATPRPAPGTCPRAAPRTRGRAAGGVRRRRAGGGRGRRGPRRGDGLQPGVRELRQPGDEMTPVRGDAVGGVGGLRQSPGATHASAAASAGVDTGHSGCAPPGR